MPTSSPNVSSNGKTTTTTIDPTGHSGAKPPTSASSKKPQTHCHRPPSVAHSDKYDGLLTARITGQESEVSALDRQIERWDVRLEQRRATLERTYARLETMLSQMQSQSAYLSSQLSNLPSFDTGGK